MSDLIPVPKGMCPAFYQFMGAGAPRSDSGEILMLSEKGPTMRLDTANYEHLLRENAALTDKLAEAEAECESRRAQQAELNAELLDLARRYDPNCDIYVYEDQANAMDAARQTVEAMQELAEFLGRDPEGCLTDCPDEAMGRIEKAEAKVARYDDDRPLTPEIVMQMGGKFARSSSMVCDVYTLGKLTISFYMHPKCADIYKRDELLLRNATAGNFAKLIDALGVKP